MKRILSMLLCLALALSLAGCSGKGEELPDVTPHPVDTAAPSSPSISGDAVVASIGDRSVLRKELMSEYNAMLYMYSYYGYPTPTSDADVETYQNYILEDLVGTMLLLRQADLRGITPLGDEEKSALRTQLEADKAEQFEQYVGYATEEGAAEPEKRAIEMINEELATYGWGMDYDAYWEYQYNYLESQRVIALLEESVRAETSATEEEAKAWYDAQVGKDTAAYSGENRSKYLSAREAYDMHGGDPVTFVPDGYLRIKVLTLIPEGTADPAMLEAESAAAELEKEYGSLALNGGNETRLREIEAQYASVREQADTLRSAYMGAVRGEAEDIARRLEAGEDFDDLLLEYDDTEDYKTYPAFAGKGKLLFTDGEDGWSPALREAALSLEPGACSGVIEDGTNLCFVYLAGPEPEGPVPFEDVKEAVYEAASAEKKDAAWAEKYEAWYGDDSGVTYFEENYRDIGK